MAVRQQDGIEAIQTYAHRLLTKVGSCVDNHVLAIAGQQNGGAKTFVARVGGTADAARAAERGDAHRCAGAENGDF